MEMEIICLRMPDRSLAGDRSSTTFMGSLPRSGFGSSPGHRRSPAAGGGRPRQGADVLKAIALPAAKSGGVGAHHQVELHQSRCPGLLFCDRGVVREGFPGAEHRLQQRPYLGTVGRLIGADLKRWRRSCQGRGAKCGDAPASTGADQDGTAPSARLFV